MARLEPGDARRRPSVGVVACWLVLLAGAVACDGPRERRPGGDPSAGADAGPDAGEAAPGDGSAPDARASSPDGGASTSDLGPPSPDVGAPDIGPPPADLGPGDAGAPPTDLGAPDVGSHPTDLGASDLGAPDAGSHPTDLGALDLGAPDVGSHPTDLGAPDLGPADIGPPPDAAPPDAAPPPPACVNGIDDDADGLADHPDDPECTGATDADEAWLCAPDLPVTDLGPEGGRAQVVMVTGAPLGPTCGALNVRGVVRLRLERAADVEVAAAGTWIDIVAARGVCDDPATERFCNRVPDRVDRLPTLEAGTWWLLLGFTSDRLDRPPWTMNVDVRVRPVVADCADGDDDDGDGLADAADPGCADAFDADESDDPATAACVNGADDDGDGLADWPEDPDCAAAGDPTEAPRCFDDLPIIEVPEAGGRFRVEPPPGPEQYNYCATGGVGREQIFAVTLTAPATLDYSASDDRSEFAYLGTCREGIDAVQCGAGRSRDLAPGVHYFAWQRRASTDPVDVVFAVRPVNGACADGLDDDGDGRADAADPGCVGPRDDTEEDPRLPPACANGLDDDGDGAADWPADGDCAYAGSAQEAARCPDGVRLVEVDAAYGLHDVTYAPGEAVVPPTCDEGVGREIVFAFTLDRPSLVAANGDLVGLRARCDAPETEMLCGRSTAPFVLLPPGTWFLTTRATDETGQPGATVQPNVLPLPLACDDGLDNDGDGRVDAADFQCAHALDWDEEHGPSGPACTNGADDDDDGAVDWPADPECAFAGQTFEGPGCPDGVAVRPLPEDFAYERVPLIEAAGGPLGAGACGAGGGAAHVLAVPVSRPAELAVLATSGPPLGDAPLVSVRRACGDPATEVACRSEPGPTRVRVEPGTWFVVVERPPGDAALFADVSLALMSLGACEDMRDNDGDGLVDVADPGCVGFYGDAEDDPPAPPACANGRDDDGDGAVDFPDDADCLAAGGCEGPALCVEGPADGEVAAPGAELRVDLRGAADRVDGCAAVPAADALFRLPLHAPSDVTVEVLEADFPVEVGVLAQVEGVARGPGAMRTRACLRPRPDAPATAGRLRPGPYLLVVEGVGGRVGTTRLAVRIGPTPRVP